MLFSLLKHYLDLYISDSALKVSLSLYCFTTSICHGVENYFPRLWGTDICDAIFNTKLSNSSINKIRWSYESAVILKRTFYSSGPKNDLLLSRLLLLRVLD